jgi:hypothetical protein
MSHFHGHDPMTTGTGTANTAPLRLGICVGRCVDIFFVAVEAAF